MRPVREDELLASGGSGSSSCRGWTKHTGEHEKERENESESLVCRCVSLLSVCLSLLPALYAVAVFILSKLLLCALLCVLLLRRYSVPVAQFNAAATTFRQFQQQQLSTSWSFSLYLCLSVSLPLPNHHYTHSHLVHDDNDTQLKWTRLNCRCSKSVFSCNNGSCFFTTGKVHHHHHHRHCQTWTHLHKHTQTHTLTFA